MSLTLGSHRSSGDASWSFTLLELLVVIAIISILLIAVIPAVNSLSKSGGRKAAINNLLGAVEQTRTAAIKDGQATYLVFATFPSGNQSTLDRYNFKSYAIFEDDAAGSATAKQLTGWKTLPTGVSLRANQAAGNGVTNLATVSALPSPAPTFNFTPDSAASPTFYVIKFNNAGEVDTPAANIVLGVFEGFVNNGNEMFTTGKDKNGNPLASEYLVIAEHTGRAEPTATATP